MGIIDSYPQHSGSAGSGDVLLGFDTSAGRTQLFPVSGLGCLFPVATTGLTGFALQNGTPTILSWTAPNDGQMHRVWIPAYLTVTQAETGGQILLSFTGPDGTPRAQNFISAGLPAGFYGSSSPQFQSITVKAGSTVSLSQNTALTAGAATLWAEIWGL